LLVLVGQAVGVVWLALQLWCVTFRGRAPFPELLALKIYMKVNVKFLVLLFATFPPPHSEITCKGITADHNNL